MLTTDERKRVLQDTLNFRMSVLDASDRLKGCIWDCEAPLIIMTSDQLYTALERYVLGDLSSPSLRTWAEFFEVREDVGYPSDKEALMSSILYHIATPETQGDLTLAEAAAYMQALTRGPVRSS